MKPLRFFLLLALLIAVTREGFANGVLIFNASSPTCANLVSSQVTVTINEQVAITQSTQVFVN
ncbi:MAG TPA: hypothetical protein VEO56_03355, partial [Bacteroidota bacterium]|nr:hypothetical protein [Bacteroidota bacterium]